MGQRQNPLRLAILRLAAAAMAFAALPRAEAAPAPRAAFDRARIHADYQAGDFEKVIPALEAFLESGRRCRKEDSVFLEKHLAVVYAAAPATRERGRYHMLRMLDLDPRADLLDMFVGEEVDGIFEKVRRESAVRRTPAAPPPARRTAAAVTGNNTKTGTGIGISAKTVTGAGIASSGPAPRLEAWNLGPEPRSGGPARATASGSPAAARASAARSSAPRASAPAASVATAPGMDEANPSLRPRWKEPGFWVGGGAAVAVVGLSLYFSGARAETDSRSRTFAVPSKPVE